MNRTVLTTPQSELLHQAIDCASNFHKGQVRKVSNLPYIVHPLRVMAALQDQSYEVQVAAVLHDTIEDTELLPAVIQVVWGKYIASLVLAVTKDDDPDPSTRETYAGFIDRIISFGPDAIRIKMADIEDNMADGSPGRQDRYSKAHAKLAAALLATIDFDHPEED